MMFDKWKGILFAVILGLLCPGIIIRMIKERPEIQDPISETTVETSDNEERTILMNVLMDDGSIKTMEMNEYLTCVVLEEMPASFEIEALKAQAVVARTYGLRRQEKGGKHISADVCTNSDCCQGYFAISEYLKCGGTVESVERVKNAVASTNSLVLVYRGELIDATYFSCSGGKTEDAKEVWGTEIPYLKSTESPGEEHADHYLDTVVFSADDFLKRLGLENKDTVRVGKIQYTSGGGVDTISISGEVFEGTDFRKKLDLRSTAFVISAVENTVIITTKGFGHRVGMSQYGADAMAVSGYGFPEILAHYYQGTQLVSYISN